MQPKPAGFDTRYAEAFKNQLVVDAYRYRPPYSDETFAILASLITDEPRAVLDVGAGSGDIARRMVEFVERVDAVDFSEAMIARGKQLPDGEHPRLHWIYGTAEDAPLSGPYALITAGSSIHWMDWPRAFPRFRSLLTPHGFLAVVYRRTLPMVWNDALRTIRRQFSTRRTDEQGSENAIEALVARGLFQVHGEKTTTPIPFNQPIDDFITGLHSRSGFSVEGMGEEQAGEFDWQVRTLLLSFHPDGVLPLQSIAIVTWGTPLVASK